MITVQVLHKTSYRYANPVSFQQHRLMCRPREGHELRLVESGLSVTPVCAVRWMQDVFGNSVALLDFTEPASELVVESSVTLEHYPSEPHGLPLDAAACQLPLSYSLADAEDLGSLLKRHYDDPDGEIGAWAQGFVEANGADTLATLTAMCEFIHREFAYLRRVEEGTWPPANTFANKSGSCRDYALLMMEAARSLGLAARFVSGYLYDDQAVEDAASTIGGGETHAWLQVFLPGAGWVAFDPTNALVAGRKLIPVAYARDPAQASPLSGGFEGLPNDFLGMNVEVNITQATQPG